MMTRLPSRIAIFAIFALCSGCVRQVGWSALEMQESYRTVLYKQILFNLREAMHAPLPPNGQPAEAAFLPSQVLVSAGTAQVTGTINPSITIPLPTTTLTTAKTFAAASSGTNTSATALSNASFGVSVTDSNVVTWTLGPRNDPDELMRLRGLYLYAVGRLAPYCPTEMELIGKAPSPGEPPETPPVDCLWRYYPMQGGNNSPNPVFVNLPNCVFCNVKETAIPLQSTTCPDKLSINPRLLRLHNFITDSPPDTKNWTRLATNYGFTNFYVRSDFGEAALNYFVLFILEALSQASAPQGVKVDCAGNHQPPSVTPSPSFHIETFGPKPNLRLPPPPTSNVPDVPMPPKIQNNFPIAIGVP
jgi:hypothetical protein